MNLHSITPLLLTFNEEANLTRTLTALQWAKNIVIVDSYSSDATATIARSFQNVTFQQKHFDTHAQQWNHGLSLITSPWVLTLDADYLVSDDFVAELVALKETDVTCYSARLIFCVAGRPLRCSVLPARVVLFQVAQHRYFDDGHTQRLTDSSSALSLRSRILHDDRKSVSRWLCNQRRYAKLEATKLIQCPFRSLPVSARIRCIPFLMCFISPLYILVYRWGLIEFWQGWLYALQRTVAEAFISYYVVLIRLGYTSNKNDQQPEKTKLL